MRDAGGRSVYALPTGGEEASSSSIQALQRVLAEFAVTIVPTGNLVLISTRPGAAQVVAGGIDRGGVDGVLGTVVVNEDIGGRRVADELEKLGAGN